MTSMFSMARGRRVPATLAILFAACAFAVPDAARSGTVSGSNDHSLSRYGGRLGLSSGPDQITFGLYAGFGELTPGLQLRPSADIGFGDDVFSILMNADVQYYFHVQDFRASPYFGGGLGVAYYDFDLPADVPIDDSTTEIGINFYVGVEKSLSNYKTGHLELRIGVDEMPDLKLTFGFGFY